MNKISFLKDLLSIYSPSGLEKEISEYLNKNLNLLGFNTRCDEVGNVIATIGNGEPNIVFLGHIDTVKGFIEVREENGKIYGRGAVDAKGPLSAFICAVYEIKENINKTITIIGAVEEEGDSKGARYIIDKYSPEYAIIGEPSDWNGITLGYKGSLELEYNLKKDKIHFSGVDITAVESGVDFWNRIESYCINFSKDRKIFDGLIPTLISINSIDDDFYQNVNLKINIRTPLDFDIEKFVEWLGKQNGDGEIIINSFEPAVKFDKNNKLVRAFVKSIRNQGCSPTFKLKTGTSDMNIVAQKWTCPIVAYGPGNSSLDHTPNEYLSIDEYLKSIEVLKSVIIYL